MQDGVCVVHRDSYLRYSFVCILYYLLVYWSLNIFYDLVYDLDYHRAYKSVWKSYVSCLLYNQQFVVCFYQFINVVKSSLTRTSKYANRIVFCILCCTCDFLTLLYQLISKYIYIIFMYIAFCFHNYMYFLFARLATFFV